MGANKPVAPASLLQVGGAGRVVGKKSLELWERLWEPKIARLVNVHEHGRTLPLVAVGDNRIGKLPGTELAFERDVEYDHFLGFFPRRRLHERVARFRRVNMNDPPSTMMRWSSRAGR